ncbi:acyltransferase family protein [Salipiger bermudensis]|uniref:Acyltransferase/acetyltransferase n=1 Tax=Salipiger bermudensis (strain DSM 26914 / JCM 13377 / KCTC 12554 / HTCC2601) TaxID=314265 RepID=Q0FNZ3_SALBH|nr:acyltransferase [Salipiger bermudensis]EAU45910.1 acyltransferase/acetyltransferase [Salipiger bermudensis HTCC2601]
MSPVATATRSDAPITPTATRVAWLDQAKGVGIVLVVVGHCWLGLAGSGILSDPGTIATVEQLIYTFHMPLFFLLSGYTFEGWARRRRLGEALKSRVLRLLWPLVLWTYVFAGFKIAAGAAANSPVGLEALMVLPLPPQNHLWFLWALFILHALALPVCALPRTPLPTATWFGLLLAVLALVLFSGIDFGVLFSPAAIHAAVFVLGIWLARLPLPRIGLAAGLAAVALFAAIEMAGLTVPDLPERLGPYLAASIALSLCLCAALAGLVPAKSAPGRLLAWLGGLSMPIFLAHTIFSAATRVALQRVSDDATLHLVSGTAIGLAGPILLNALLRKFADPRLAGF